MDSTIPGFDRITMSPGKLGGKPCIRGLRISVADVMRALAGYPSQSELLADYPDLEPEDLQQAAAFATAMLDWNHLQETALPVR